jgi:hypothetical protein
MPAVGVAPAQPVISLSERAWRIFDTAWELTTRSRLGCQAVVKGDVVVEFPMYTRNYVQEGGAIQLGQPDDKEKARKEAEVQS